MKIDPVGDYAAGFELEREDVFRHALSVADVVSFSLRGLCVSTEPGKPVRAKIAQGLRCFQGAKVVGLVVAHRWFGTTTRNSLVAKLGLSSVTRRLLESQGALMTPPGRWQDLCLFRRERVLVWSCTHERDAVIFGSQADLLVYGLTPRLATSENVDAREVVREAVESICADL